ncbi:Os09g0376100 [Oryza sativa Japonica Group]|uniref:Os09g0376100 protein n=1 Tax=Oryza sativa subsp. japonica TaxID=39947 RepID=A0A0P0XMD1_ORYSJ|nr:Os09g0376100 [Oryza sativa Japonica Group]
MWLPAHEGEVGARERELLLFRDATGLNARSHPPRGVTAPSNILVEIRPEQHQAHEAKLAIVSPQLDEAMVLLDW